MFGWFKRWFVTEPIVTGIQARPQPAYTAPVLPQDSYMGQPYVASYVPPKLPPLPPSKVSEDDYAARRRREQQDQENIGTSVLTGAVIAFLFDNSSSPSVDSSPSFDSTPSFDGFSGGDTGGGGGGADW